MRKLRKGPVPPILELNAADWTSDLLEALERDEKPTKTQIGRYNTPEIKSAIRAETLNKCAYCESKISHIDHGDIEHIIPKSKVPDLAFAWVNLTLACRICNQSKGDFYSNEDDHSALVDPYQDEPTDHFIFYREIVVPRHDSDRGLLTDKEIGLSRGPLRERRKERMDFIDDLVRGYCNANDVIKPILKQNIYTRCCGDGSEYSALAKHYVDNIFSTLDR